MYLKRKVFQGWRFAYICSVFLSIFLRPKVVFGKNNLRGVKTKEFWDKAKKDIEQTEKWSKLHDKKNWGSPLVVAIKHVNFFDMFAVGMFFGPRFPFRILAKSELFRNRYLAKTITWFGAIKVNRGVKDLEAAKKSLFVLGNNEWLAIYPEGTIKGGNDFREFESTINLAQKKCAFILPVSLRIEGKIFKRILISFGKPYFPKGRVAEEAQTLEININTFG